MSDDHGERRSDDCPADVDPLGAPDMGREADLSEQLSRPEVEQLYALFGKRVMAFLVGLLRDIELAEEVCQTTFLVAIKHAGAITGDVERGRWLMTVARNEAFRLRRRQGVERRGRERTVLESLQRKPGPSSQAPEALLEHEERIAEVQQALQALPDEQRQIVEARIFQSQTFAEFATKQHIPLGTALTRMRLALEKLRQLLLHRDTTK